MGVCVGVVVWVGVAVEVVVGLAVFVGASVCVIVGVGERFSTERTVSHPA